MRLFPSGRGTHVADDTPTKDEYLKAIQLLRELEKEYGLPKVKLQCALKFLEPQNLKKNPCDMVVESFGLMADGTLLASPWAFNSVAKPLSNEWVLGNLVNNTMKEILGTNKAKHFIANADNNFGHCKIHAYFSNPQDSTIIFKKADPLYSL